jgi:hypothetical protein
MCGPHRGQGHPGWWGRGCCCGCGTFPRRFFAAKEKEDRLQKYADELKKELAGVEEHIRELKGE